MNSNDENIGPYEVLVYGGTVAGIAAALASARCGRKTILIERGIHFGGMAASGLGLVDSLRENAFGGIHTEFLSHIRTYYENQYGPDSDQYGLTLGGRFMEPGVSEKILDQMIAAETNLQAFKNLELSEVIVEGDTVVGSRYRDRTNENTISIQHKVAIDGTYEGDFAAASGVSYRVGREGRKDYDEKYAGIIYHDWRQNHQELHPLSSGEPSDLIQAFCFRLTLTDDPEKRVPIAKPDAYDDFYPMYKGILTDFSTGRVRCLAEILWLNPLANRKYCVNGHIEALTSIDLATLCSGWPDGNWETRDKLYKQYKDYTLGLLYFMQNDPAVARVPQTEVSRFGLPADEYPDNEHFPWQLYVRQGRRIQGEYTITEHDSIPPEGRLRPPIHKDTIGICEHSFDGHACRNREDEGAIAETSDGFQLLEGTIWFRNRLKSPNRPATVPYRAILPEKVNGLLVTASISSSNVAFSSLRMEPVWMALGQAAGQAASMAFVNECAPRNIDVQELQNTLMEQGQVLVYFDKLALDDPNFAQIQLQAITENHPDYDLSNLK